MGLLINGQVGWRTAGVVGAPAAASTLWTSVYGVWNADTLGTSLDTSIHRVYNGDNVNDTSGNAQNGTNVGGVTFTTGKVGNAFTFNGSNYVKLPNNSLNLSDSGSDAYSISLWGYLTNTGLATGLLTNFMQNDPSTILNGWNIWHWGERIYFTRCDGTGTSASSLNTGTVPLITMNAWHHIVVTRKNGSTKLYVDGVLRASDTSTVNTVYATTHKPLLGARNSYNPDYYDWFSGNGSKIDGVNVWTKELTAADVTNLYNAGTGAEYPFSAQTLATPNDSVSTNHGTLVNGTTFTTGKIGQAFNFDGINDMVTLPNNALNFNSDFSVSAWVKYTVGSGIKTIVSNNTLLLSPTRQYGYGMYLNGTNILFQTYDGTSTVGSLSYTASLTSGTWYHIVITKSSTTKTIYLNGSLVTSGAVNNVTYTTTHRPTIGGQRYDATGTEYFSVSPIDAVSTWARELTASDVTNLYNAGAGKQYPTT